MLCLAFNVAVRIRFSPGMFKTDWRHDKQPHQQALKSQQLLDCVMHLSIVSTSSLKTGYNLVSIELPRIKVSLLHLSISDRGTGIFVLYSHGHTCGLEELSLFVRACFEKESEHEI